MKIPITKPVIGDEEKEAILKPLESGWLVQGPYVQEFEKLFCQFTGARFAKATTSCTTALHLALEAVGVQPGDKVVVPSFTFVASANAVEYTGAEVIFCDIDLKTFNIDVGQLRQLLKKDRNKKIKALMPVNLFGLCADLPAIMKLAQEFKLKVVEDSACGLGAYIGEKHSGTFGDAGCFSFHPRKPITTGEGGMVITDSEEIASHVNSLRDHGAAKSDLQRHKKKGGSRLPAYGIKGYNYRLTDLQASLGVCQMKKADKILGGRRQVAEKYNKSLKGFSPLVIPYVPASYTHGYQSYVCLFVDPGELPRLTVDKINQWHDKRNLFMNRLEEEGIATRQGTHAVHTLGYYKNKYRLNEKDYLYSYAADRLSVTLPLYAGMSNEEFDFVIENITRVLKKL